MVTLIEEKLFQHRLTWIGDIRGNTPEGQV
jgi:hypothetical protein